MGSLIGLIFVLWIFGYMAYQLWPGSSGPKPKHSSNDSHTKPIEDSKTQKPFNSDDGSFKLFIKITFVPLILIAFLGAALSQCDSGSNRKSSSNGSGWGQSNSCGKGSWFDEFSDGGGQWRNKDGKFCSR